MTNNLIKKIGLNISIIQINESLDKGKWSVNLPTDADPIMLAICDTEEEGEEFANKLLNI